MRNVPDEITIRTATESDTTLILSLIRELAEYERLLHEVTATEDGLRESLFGERPYAHALIAETAAPEPRAVGFALYFFNYSTFVGRPGIYLEDLFVRPEFRGRGFGRALMQAVAAIAVQHDCGRFEWSVLDWNTPSIVFYRSLGARPMDDWTVYRLEGRALRTLADGKSATRREESEPAAEA